MPLQLFTNTLSILLFIMWAIVGVFGIIWFIEWRQHHLKRFLRWCAPYVLIFFPLLGIILSLVYQYGFHLPPCDLCWIQRIFLYPLFLYGITQYVEKKHNWLFPGIMASLGALFALFHYLLHRSVIGSSFFCGGTGAVDCSKIDVQSFGFVTIPLLSLTFFVIIAVIMWYEYRQSKKSS